METGDPKPWHRAAPDALVYRASPVRVALSLSPLVAFLLAGSALQYALQYALQGALSPGMEWVLGGTGALVLAAVLVLPRINYLEFTPQYFALHELFACKRIAWGDVEPDSIGSSVYTLHRFPLFTKIGFRVRPGSPYHTVMRILAGARTGMHVSFVNLYPIHRDEIVDTLRTYQAWYGADTRRVSGARAGVGAGPAEPVLGDPAAPGPRYNLIVLNDDTHTYGYVERLLQEVLGVSAERATAFALAIDRTGRAVVFIGSLDEVTRKRDRILAYGPDASEPESTGPLGVEVVEVR
jgi:ATP-dependent Clp protease adaptor protein ClpS